MNRRGFLAMLAAPFLARLLPVASSVKAIAGCAFRGLTYKGHPIVVDPAVPPNTVYLVNPERFRTWTHRA